MTYSSLIQFALLLVLGSFLQQTQGLRCHKCDTPKCAENDPQIEKCVKADDVCVGMEFVTATSVLPTKPPIPRGCYSAADAKCVGNTDNKCYSLPSVREACKHIMLPIVEKMLHDLLLPLSAELVIQGLDGKICACTTDLCNNDISGHPISSGGKGTTDASGKSSGAMIYGNLKLHAGIGILFMVLTILM